MTKVIYAGSNPASGSKSKYCVRVAMSVVRIHPSAHLMTNKEMKHPDPKKHQIVSFVKSAVRIIGYMMMPFNLYAAAFILVISEVVGIWEEMV